MDFYIIVVTLAAIIYSLISRFVQDKFINKAEMQEIQDVSKKLGDEYKEASKRNDKAKMDEIAKKQIELVPKMSKVMGSQFLIIGVVMIVFFSLLWALGNFDPNLGYNKTIELKNDGSGCDNSINGVFTACYSLTEGNSGEWSVHVQSYKGQQKVSERNLYFWFNTNISEIPGSVPNGNLNATLGKISYSSGDQLKIFAKPDNADSVKATIDQGHSFYVDLPFTIPVLGIKRIRGVYYWFIFVNIIFTLLLSLILSKIKKGAKK